MPVLELFSLAVGFLCSFPANVAVVVFADLCQTCKHLSKHRVKHNVFGRN